MCYGGCDCQRCNPVDTSIGKEMNPRLMHKYGIFDRTQEGVLRKARLHLSTAISHINKFDFLVCRNNLISCQELLDEIALDHERLRASKKENSEPLEVNELGFTKDLL